MLEFIFFVLGILTGVVIFTKVYTNGILKVTYMEEKDSYTLFVDDMDKISKRRYLLLKIDKGARRKHVL